MYIIYWIQTWSHGVKYFKIFKIYFANINTNTIKEYLWVRIYIYYLVYCPLGPNNLAMHTCFGDGTQIPQKYVSHVRNVFYKNMIFERWQKGDMIMIDNFRISHGRQVRSLCTRDGWKFHFEILGFINQWGWARNVIDIADQSQPSYLEYHYNYYVYITIESGIQIWKAQQCILISYIYIVHLFLTT